MKPLCQSGESIAKLKAPDPKTPCEPCCLIATRGRFSPMHRPMVPPRIIRRRGRPWEEGRWTWAKNGRRERLAEPVSAKYCYAGCVSGAMSASTELLRQCLPAALAAFVAWTVLVFLLRHADSLPLDRPNARSLHRRAIPRGGGLAIWAGWFAGTLWLNGPKPWLAPLLIVIGVSLWDDRRGVHAALRLAVHAGAAVLWLWLADPLVNPVVAVVAVVWMANLYNFMDGSDGLAGAMTIVGFGAYAAAAAWAGASDSALFLALAAATAPFLVRNAPPARVFLGDVGSVPLGFLAAIFGIAGWSSGWWPLWFPLLVFLPFVADASVTLALRFLRRARVWEAHREHYYQRLVQLGWGHSRTLKLFAALMLGSAGSALAALFWAPVLGVALLVAWSLVLALVYAAIEYHWRRRRSQDINESKC